MMSVYTRKREKKTKLEQYFEEGLRLLKWFCHELELLCGYATVLWILCVYKKTIDFHIM